jgi:hypothetical protein
MSCPWGAYEPGTIAFCEERMCAWVVEPSNAWSNLAYVLCGVIVLLASRRRAGLVLIGIAGVLIGLGSFAFHGTGTRVGELIDVSAMYLLSALAIVFALRRITALSTGAFVATYAGIVALSVGLMMGLHNNGIIMFALQLTIAVGAEVYLFSIGRRASSYTWQKWMLASFVTAFAIWNLDKWNVLCRPTNHFITGHALWHVLTAVALYCFARHQDQLID